MENEIAIPAETKPRLKKIKEGYFSFEWAPQYALLSKEPSAFIFPGMALSCFNPSSLPVMREIKEGDHLKVLITKYNLEGMVYQMWNPPPKYQLTEGERDFVVKVVATDASNYPIIIASERE